MKGDLTFIVPGIPVPCARARTVRVKRAPGDPRPPARRTFTPDRTTEYEARVAYSARAAAGRLRWQPHPDAVYALLIDVFRETRIGDWDNYGKGVADALTKARLWADDRYVVDARVRLHVDRARPRIEVVVRALNARELAEGACAECLTWAFVGKPCPTHDGGRGLEALG